MTNKKNNSKRRPLEQVIRAARFILLAIALLYVFNFWPLGALRAVYEAY